MSFRRIDIDIGSDNGSITLFFDRGILYRCGDFIKKRGNLIPFEIYR